MAVVSRVTDDLVVGLYVEGAPVNGLDVVETVLVVDVVVGAIVVAVAVVGFVVVVVVVGVVVVGAGVVVLAAVVVVVVVGAGVVVVVGTDVVVVVVGGCGVLVDGGVWVNVGKLGSPLHFRVRAAVESPTIVVILCFLVRLNVTINAYIYFTNTGEIIPRNILHYFGSFSPIFAYLYSIAYNN